MTVRDDLEQFGPQQQEIIDLPAAEAYCARLAGEHYENFPVVSWLLPRELRQHFANVYAFCRWADDLGDELGDREESLRMLSWWQQELDRCYQGERRHPVFVALGPTIERFQIPQQPLADLISAFQQDQTVQEYATFEQLRDYCRRSADPVGRIVLYLYEHFDPDRARLSDHVCTGLQLANFWQDVARDADIGRVYLPREDREAFGYSEADRLARRATPEFRELMRFEVDRARQQLLAGKPLVPTLPSRLQVPVDLFIEGGLAILRNIEQLDYNVWRHRPQVSKWQLAQAALGSVYRTMSRLIWQRS